MNHTLSDIQDHFEHISKKNNNNNERLTANTPITIYVNKIENRINLKFNQDIILNFYYLN